MKLKKIKKIEEIKYSFGYLIIPCKRDDFVLSHQVQIHQVTFNHRLVTITLPENDNLLSYLTTTKVIIMVFYKDGSVIESDPFTNEKAKYLLGTLSATPLPKNADMAIECTKINQVKAKDAVIFNAEIRYMWRKDNMHIIDTVTQEIYEKVAELWQLTGVGNPARGDSLQVVQNTIKTGGKLLTGWNGNSLLAVCWLTSDARRLYVHHFAVHPTYEGLGYGQELMDMAIQYAKEMNQQMKLEVHIDNIRAEHLYEKKGFKKLDGYQVYINRETQRKE